MEMKILTPAYGRDYKSAKAVIADYEGGKDFILNDITSQWDGKYCSIRDFPEEVIQLRYNKYRKVTTYKP